MADLLDYIPVFSETADSIRARMDADANAGLSTDDPRWIDTREGTFYWDVTQPFVLEMARLWDALSVEVPAAAYPLFAWGEYLDEHADVFGLERKEAVPAGGYVTFVGESGTIVATGTVVSSDPVTDEDEGMEFMVTRPGVITGGMPAPSGVSVTPSLTGGTLADGDYYYIVTALNAFGETDGSERSLASLEEGTGEGSVALNWADVPGATGYRVYRATEEDGDAARIYDDTDSNTLDTGLPGGVLGPEETNATAGVTVAVEAVDPGSDGNIGVRTIVNLDTPNEGVDEVYNAEPMQGGTEVESDADLRERILFEFEGQGGGNEADYRRWSLSRPGVGKVFVNPLWQGPGTVQVVLMTTDGKPVTPEVVEDVQTYLDPEPGLGSGIAPIGATVTVQTPVLLVVDVVGTAVFNRGYSLDGDGGTIATRDQITKSIRDYIDGLQVGEDVIYEHVKAQFFRVQGTYTIASVTINGGTDDLAVTADPPVVAALGEVELS